MSTSGRRSNRFRETLEKYRQSEQSESILLVAQDRCLIRLLAVWDERKVQRRKRLLPFPENDDEEACWKWLWQNVFFSMEALSGLTGLSVDTVEQKMAVLIGNRLIYPDGTMTRLAAQFLRIRVLGLFRVRNSSQKKLKGLAEKEKN